MPKLRTLIAWLFSASLLCSCNVSCSVGDKKSTDKSNTSVKSSVAVKNGATITNNIELDSKGLKISSATLSLENGNRVADDNVVKLNEKIYLRIHVDSGWTNINGKSYIGASEKIETDGGDLIISAEDIFKDYNETGFSSADAKDVSLSAIITSTKPGIKYFLVSYRVWDKKSNAELSGQYKFYIKE